MSCIQSTSSHLTLFQLNIIILPSVVGLPRDIFLQVLKFKLCVHLISSTGTTYPGHYIFLSLITVNIFGAECQLWKSSICSLFPSCYLHSFGSKYSFQHCILKHLWFTEVCPLVWWTKFHTFIPYKTTLLPLELLQSVWPFLTEMKAGLSFSQGLLHL